MATSSSSSHSEGAPRPKDDRLAAALHRLRSTLARTRAELELAAEDGTPPPVERLLGDLGEALGLLGEVESAAFGIARALVVDDDERLGELTARALRRQGIDAEAAVRFQRPALDQAVVFDLGLAPSLSADERAKLRAARPIVVTGATDPASRRLAEDLAAFAYLVKPADPEELAKEVRRRLESRSNQR